MLRIRLCGELAVEHDGVAVSLPASRRACALLGYLALHPGPQPRGDVAALFWPDVLDASARASLRSAMWALRASLGPAADAHLLATRSHVGLVDGPDLRVDVRDAEGDPDAAPLLAGFDADWVVRARDERREGLLAAIERDAQAAQERGDVGAAVELSRRAVALDPLGEQAHRALIRRLAAAGDRPAALAVAARLTDRLRRELGLAPSRATRDLVATLRDAPEPLAAAPRSAGRLPLVGREHELEELRRVWRSAERGAGGAVVVSGPAGIGKTRLVEELVDEARRGRAVVAIGVAPDIGVPAPFALWADIARDLAGRIPAPPPEAAWPADLARLSPAVARLLGHADAPAAPLPPELERARLLEAALELLEWAAATGPVLLVVEDVHLADEQSVVLLGHAARRIAELPVALVATRRGEARRPAADALVRALAARAPLVTVELEPLSDEAVGAVAAAAAPLDETARGHVVAAAEGSPLLAVEAARALARGEADAAGGLRTFVRGALARLRDDERLAVELVAAAGRPLARDELAALPVVDPFGSTAAAAEEGLLTDDGRAAGFRHALLAECTYADLPASRRAWLHERLAEALQARGQRFAAEVARHLLLAGRDRQAAEALARAAREARAVGATDEAVAFLEQALEVDGREDPDVLLDLADAEAWRGHQDAALRAFDRAVLAVDPRDQAWLARAWLRRGEWFHAALCAPTRAAHAYREALAVLDRAALEAPHERVQALGGCAWCEAVGGDPRQAEELLARVEEIVGPDGGDWIAQEIHQTRSMAAIRDGRFIDSYPPAEVAAAAAIRLGRPDLSYGALSNAACAAACAGDFDRALGYVDRSLMFLRRLGPTVHEMQMLAARSYVLTRLGRWEEARTAVADERDRAERARAPSLVATALHDAGLLALAAGEHEQGAELLGAALDGGAPVSRPLTRLRRAEALARVGRDDEAAAELRATVLEPVGPADFPETLVPRFERVEGLIALARSDLAAAARHLERAADGWRRLVGDPRAEGERYMANLVDLGRPPVIGLVEPARELDAVMVDLAALGAAAP